MMSSSLKSTFLKIYSCIFILADKSISCDLLLSQNIIDDNDSQYSDILMSVFSEAQMQMLCSIIVQIKKENCIKNHVDTVNSASQQNSFWCSDVINLFHYSEQSYSDWQDLSWCHQYDFDFNNLNNSNESALNILNAF